MVIKDLFYRHNNQNVHFIYHSLGLVRAILLLLMDIRTVLIVLNTISFLTFLTLKKIVDLSKDKYTFHIKCKTKVPNSYHHNFKLDHLVAI